MGLIRSIRTEQRIDYSFTVSEWDSNLESVGLCGERKTGEPVEKPSEQA